MLLLSPDAREAVYPEPVLERIRASTTSLTIVTPGEAWAAHRDALAEAEVIFSGWGAPIMDEAFLAAAPRLRAVFYAGGSVRYFVTDAFWRRRLVLSSAQAINAIPVAEFSTAAITMGLKRFWHYARVTRERHDFPAERPMPGCYGSTVGLLSYGAIARLVRERLRSLEVKVLIFDPFLTAEEAAAEGMRKVSIDELFAESDVVSVHTPSLKETRGLIRGHHLAQLRPGALFLNTARGEVVNEAELIEVLTRRPDLQAVLDVTSPEPPRPDSALFTLPNVALTPHIAGSMGNECVRMGQAMVDEYGRYCAGNPLQWGLDAERTALSA